MTNDNKSLAQSFAPCKHLSITQYIVVIFDYHDYILQYHLFRRANFACLSDK